MVLSSQWKMAERGSKDVSLLGMDDKRQITAVLACTPTGTLLSSQLLYQGSTTRCHPPAHVVFPHGWDIWHSESHWSTRETVKRFISKILKPYADSVISELALPVSQRGLVILDVYAAHRTPDVLEEFQRNGFEVVFVPANCTSELQPLDLSLNAKRHVKTALPSGTPRKYVTMLKSVRSRVRRCLMQSNFSQTFACL